MLTGLKVLRAGGAYDRFGFREISGGDVQQVIPPLKNAAVRLPKKEAPLPAYPIQRNEAVRYIQQNGLLKNLKGRQQSSLTERQH
jgi:hypothetical protein